MSLFRPSELFHFLDELGSKAKKSLSQNFLIDGNIIRKILEAANVQKDDLVIEIGPGPGALTQALLEKGARVIAIEKDAQFAGALLRLQTSDMRLQVYEEDFLKFPLEDLLKDEKKAKVVANLPYHITTPIIARLVPLYQKISSLTLMVQKEVGMRFVAKKGTSDYSSFSIFLQNFCEPSYCFTVEPTCFYPKPKVQSAVVKLTLKEPLMHSSQESFFQMVRSAFQQRRKMIRASLKEIYGKEALQKALADLRLNPNARPEELSLQEFIGLFDLLKHV